MTEEEKDEIREQIEIQLRADGHITTSMRLDIIKDKLEDPKTPPKEKIEMMHLLLDVKPTMQWFRDIKKYTDKELLK